MVVAGLAVTMLVAFVILFTWPWRVEATLKATTGEASSDVSLGGGLEVLGLALSASGAAILGGPGVAVIHWRSREMWRRSIARVDLDALFDFLDRRDEDDDDEEEHEKKKGISSRLVRHTKDALVSRTDPAGLPGLGLRIIRSLRDVSLRGAVLFGSSDPGVVGKTAAWLYPIAGVLAPFGTLDVSFDWTGRSVLNGDVEISFRVVPARVALEALRFTRHHNNTPASNTI
jgi:hypothetical protein